MYHLHDGIVLPFDDSPHGMALIIETAAIDDFQTSGHVGAETVTSIEGKHAEFEENHGT